MWPFDRQQKRAQTSSAPSESELKDAAPKLSADELLLQSVVNFRERTRSVEARVREEHLVAISDDQKRIEYSNQFIRSSGLDSALLSLLKEMWHWPAWSKRPDFEGHRRVELAELTADEVQSTDRALQRKSALGLATTGTASSSMKIGHSLMTISGERFGCFLPMSS